MERPILFSTEMVKAILAGKKTQTRRIVKGTALEWLAPDMFVPEFVADPDNELCPYGETGDLIWVRESYLKKPNVTEKMLRDGSDTWADYYYLTDTNIDELKSWGWKVKPSIHMPKKAARIWLQIEEVRIERLQDITEEDAQAEGVQKDYYGFGRGQKPVDRIPTFKHGFISIWSKINGFDSYQANPWVWVIKFNVLSTTGKPKL